MPDSRPPHPWEPPRLPRRRRHLVLAGTSCLGLAALLGIVERWFGHPSLQVVQVLLILAGLVLIILVYRGNRRDFGRWLP